jgi:site-specific DNA-methyltransferase (adenine-specific)
MTWKVINGSSAEVLKGYPDNHFDSVVCDPPYGINFLGKNWDSNTGDKEVYEQCYRVLKPGGHLLAFSAARTYHHLAMTVETVGFEIRDQIMWIYGSGFPKSQDVGRQINKRNGVQLDNERYADDEMILQANGKYLHKTNGKEYTKYPDINGGEMAKVMEGASYGSIYCEVDTNTNEWTGWGTNLKPAHEPIVMARKPVIGSIRENVLKHGTGAINIDATRVGDEIFDTSLNRRNTQDEQIYDGGWQGKDGGEIVQGRFPSNVLGEISEPYQKYFYCPKVSRSERHTGFEQKPEPYDRRTERGENGSAGIQGLQKLNGKKDKVGPLAHIPVAPGSGLNQMYGSGQGAKHERAEVGNNHPTVKPVELMKYLIKLVTPPGGHILDPFNGSGSTGCAAVELGFDYTGIELDPHYVDIATVRISAYEIDAKPTTTYDDLFKEE